MVALQCKNCSAFLALVNKFYLEIDNLPVFDSKQIQYRKEKFSYSVMNLHTNWSQTQYKVSETFIFNDLSFQ